MNDTSEPPGPPPVSVVSPAQDISEDEGFSSNKEEDNTSEYDTDLQTDMETRTNQDPGKTRKLSFYMDFDPNTTPPSTPHPDKKISIISWSFKTSTTT